MMRRYMFIAATLAFLIISAIILWFGDNQPFGMIRHWSTEWPIYKSRLWPLLAVLNRPDFGASLPNIAKLPSLPAKRG